MIKAVARLQARAARVLAVVDDEQREGAGAIGLEHGGFEQDIVRPGRHLDDALVHPVVERAGDGHGCWQVLRLGKCRQHGQRGKRSGDQGANGVDVRHG
jgi:hypothetical protein